MRNRAMRAFPFTLVPVSIYVQPPCTGVSTFVDRNEGGNGRVTYKDDGGRGSFTMQFPAPPLHSIKVMRLVIGGEDQHFSQRQLPEQGMRELVAVE